MHNTHFTYSGTAEKFHATPIMELATAAADVGDKIARNFIINADSYKTTHWQYYAKKVQGYFSHGEARLRGPNTIKTVFAGLQMYAIKYLLIRITTEDVDAAEEFVNLHMGPGVFNRSDWDYIVDEHDGKLPITIRAPKEGMVIPSGNVLYSVECVDERVHWIASYIETSLQRAVWYGTTLVTRDYNVMNVLKRHLLKSADSLASLPFMHHDFGGRGATCEEQSEIGGALHTFCFKGSDTMAGVAAANVYYFCDMSAFSVRATEHSVACSYGRDEGEKEYVETLISTAPEGSIVSCVSDTYNVYEFVTMVINNFLDEIIRKKLTFVFRPDSGEPKAVLQKVYALIEQALASPSIVAKHGNLIIENSKGYKTLPSCLNVLQGDGVNIKAIDEILTMLETLGWAASSILFGSGGELIQKMNRDTLKFAQKGSAILVDGEWLPIVKDPITDPGKKSKAGRLTLLRSKMTGEFMTTQVSDHYDSEWEDMFETVFDHGEIKRLQRLEEIRELIK